MILGGDYVPRTLAARIELGEGLLLCNLEGPILPPDHGLPSSPKAGISLFSQSLPQRRGQTVFALANNHMMDFGPPGLKLTRDALAEAGMVAAGAGLDRDEARRPIIVEESGVRIGIISCCEAQFGVAGPGRAGVAEAGPWLHDAIRELRQHADHVVVSVHAAVEMSCWPSPRLQELYRCLVESGASVVHGHHAHVPQGFEAYRGGLILYGMGNCIVDPAEWSRWPQTLWSLAARIDWRRGSPGSSFSWEVFPVELRLDGNQLLAQAALPDEFQSHRTYLEACNSPLEDPKLLEALWQETSLRAFASLYASPLRAPSLYRDRLGLRDRVRALRAAGKELLRGMLGYQWPTAQSLRQGRCWHHFFGCDSHRDAIATATGVLVGELPDLRTPRTRQMADEMLCSFRRVVAMGRHA